MLLIRINWKNKLKICQVILVKIYNILYDQLFLLFK